MLLTLDGPEAAGKTTLIDTVTHDVRQYGWHVVHARSRRPHDDPFGYYLEMIKLGTRPDTLVILDRAWPSEYVYGELLGRPITASRTKIESFLHPAARYLGPTMICLPTSSQTLSDRRAARPDSSDLDVPVSLEYHEYYQYKQRFDWQLARLDDPNDTARIALNIRIELRASELRLQSGLTPPAVVGNPYSSTIFIGERQHLKNEELPPLAWAPFTDDRSRWIFDVITAPYHRLLYTTADMLADNKALQDMIRWKLRRVALGKNAQRVMKELGIAYEPLPHLWTMKFRPGPLSSTAKESYKKQVQWADEEALSIAKDV